MCIRDRSKLNEEKLPGCYLHRTAENDVARVEDRTFICTSKKEDAGPINHWMAPADAYEKLGNCLLYTSCEPSAKIRERVNHARQIQQNRYRDEGIYSNSQLTTPMVNKYCKLTRTSESLLKAAFNQFGMSARGYTRVLKLARTIADLQGDEEIKDDYLMQAISYRSLDRQRS